MAIVKLDMKELPDKGRAGRVNWDQFWQDVGDLIERGDALEVPPGTRVLNSYISVIARVLRRPLVLRTVSDKVYVVHL